MAFKLEKLDDVAIVKGQKPRKSILEPARPLETEIAQNGESCGSGKSPQGEVADGRFRRFAREQNRGQPGLSSDARFEGLRTGLGAAASPAVHHQRGPCCRSRDCRRVLT